MTNPESSKSTFLTSKNKKRLPSQDEHGVLFLDWRARTEVDPKKLIDMLLSAEKQKEKVAEEPEEEEIE